MQQRHQLLEGHPGGADQGDGAPQPAAYQIPVAHDGRMVVFCHRWPTRIAIVSDRYLVGGGLWGSIALIGPTRMPFQKLMPLLHEFADQLGEGMSGKRKDTPQAAVPRRTVIYKEDLE